MNTADEITSRHPLVIGALLDSGEARILWTDDRRQALRIVAAFKSGIYGEVRALLFGEAPTDLSRDDASAFIADQLARQAIVH